MPFLDDYLNDVKGCNPNYSYIGLKSRSKLHFFFFRFSTLCYKCFGTNCIFLCFKDSAANTLIPQHLRVQSSFSEYKLDITLTDINT